MSRWEDWAFHPLLVVTKRQNPAPRVERGREIANPSLSPALHKYENTSRGPAESLVLAGVRNGSVQPFPSMPAVPLGTTQRTPE